ncbi:MAG TPA: GNAT family N-acetyltransferase, partial [Puia sp.]|nr:GNAT family N-acetyltransferase [Puia sp.]
METTADFTIHLLSNEHATQAVDLILPIQQVEFKVAVTLDDQPDLLDIDGYYNQPDGGFWGAFKEGELIGTIGLLNVGHATGVIRKMFVRSDLRGNPPGIAQRLMQSLLDHSRNHGITDLYLGTVDKMKAAHRFYERNGFRRIAGQALPA